MTRSTRDAVQKIVQEALDARTKTVELLAKAGGTGPGAAAAGAAAANTGLVEVLGALALATLGEGTASGIFVPSAWVGQNVIVQIDMPVMMPKSDLLTQQPRPEDMAPAFPEVHGKLLADLPEGLVLSTKSMPKGYAIMKGKIYAVLLA